MVVLHTHLQALVKDQTAGLFILKEEDGATLWTSASHAGEVG